jgi:hypothetical protein
MKNKTGTRFLNVDLDIFSTVRLNKIVKAFGENVTVLYCGRWGDLFSAHVETFDSGWRANPTSVIRQLVALVKALPPAERKLWDQAKSREFNIGIEAASRSPLYELRLSPRTLREVNSVNGTIIFTVYAPEHVPKARRNTKGTTGKASNQAL